MAKSLRDQIEELESLLDNARQYAQQLIAFEGAHQPFNSLAVNANIHDMLKRSGAIADKLTVHYGRQLERENARK